jgi:hypothetical protein
MAEAADAVETPKQLINIGLIIITRSTIFASDIRKWHAKPDVKKTWPTFKTHFRDSQKAIKQSQPTITTDSLGFHEQANAASIVNQVIEKLSAQRDHEIAEHLSEQQMQQHIDQLANSSCSTQQNQTTAEQIQALTATISNLQSQVTHSQTRGRGRGSSREECGGRGRGRRNNGNARSPPQQYCWSHGKCAHN